MLNEELVCIDERIVIESDRVSDRTWKALEVATNICNDIFELFELLDALVINLVWLWPCLTDEHAISPAESLPDGLCYEWGEWVEHDEDLL